MTDTEKDKETVREGPAGATLAAFAALVVIAGGNAPAIRYISCETCELDPFWAAAMRFLGASLLFVLIGRALHVPLPRGQHLRGAVLFGILQFGAGFGFLYWGLVRVPAGVGQVLVACVPLITLGLALAHRQETFRWDRLAGGALSIGGIAVVFSAGQETGVPLGSMLAILIGSVCWAEALIVVRRFPLVHPVMMNAIAMGVGGIGLLVAALVSGESLVIPQASSTWIAQAYLVIAGSVAVFWLYVFVLRGWTATAASYQLVLIPLVTVPVSSWLQGESITAAFLLGSALVLLGVYIGALRRM